MNLKLYKILIIIYLAVFLIPAASPLFAQTGRYVGQVRDIVGSEDAGTDASLRKSLRSAWEKAVTGLYLFAGSMAKTGPNTLVRLTLNLPEKNSDWIIGPESLVKFDPALKGAPVAVSGKLWSRAEEEKMLRDGSVRAENRWIHPALAMEIGEALWFRPPEVTLGGRTYYAPVHTPRQFYDPHTGRTYIIPKEVTRLGDGVEVCNIPQGIALDLTSARYEITAAREKVKVRADKSWQGTRILVDYGDEVIIVHPLSRDYGRWNIFDVDRHTADDTLIDLVDEYSGASGFKLSDSSISKLYSGHKLLPDAPYGALLGRVTEFFPDGRQESGRPDKLVWGEKKKGPIHYEYGYFRPYRKGLLELRINESDDKLSDNVGELELYIYVLKEKKK